MSGHRKALKARRRIGPPDRGTAHRQFTTIQGDPTRKATRKYAKAKCPICSLGDSKCGTVTCINPDTVAITTILEKYAVTHNGFKTDKRGALRRNKKTKANGLAAWVIDQYEHWRRKGVSSSTALAMLDDCTVRAAVDSGEVGRWCAQKASENGRTRGKLSDETVKVCRETGPRAGHANERARWKITGDKFRQEMADAVPTTADGITKGMALDTARQILRGMGINPDT